MRKKREKEEDVHIYFLNFIYLYHGFPSQTVKQSNGKAMSHPSTEIVFV